MRDLYYRTGSAFLVVYALNDLRSYAEAIEIIDKIREKNLKKVGCTICKRKN